MGDRVSRNSAENLRTLIALLIDLQVFAPGRERAEAGELWQRVSDDSPHHFPLFDTTWFEILLAGPTAAQPNRPAAESPNRSAPNTAHSPIASSQGLPGKLQPVQLSRQTIIHAASPHIDWGLAQDVPALYGRDAELATLSQWVQNERCRIVTLVGMGGIGKTSLAITFAHQVSPHFDREIFRSLGEAPPFAGLLDHLIQWLAVGQIVTPPQPADQLALLVQVLREQRCLLVLDNLETLLQAGAVNAQYLAGYELYGELFRLLGETAHQSCLLLTSREQPPGLGALMGAHTPVRTLRVSGLPPEAIQSLRRSPDGTQLASCGDDGVILVWDLHNGTRLRTIRRDRPYERLDISGVKGLTPAQRSALLALGAVERQARS